MATTGSNFAKIATNTLSGTANQVGATTPFLGAIHPGQGGNMEANLAGVVVDRVNVDLSLTAAPTKGTNGPAKGSAGTNIGGYAKNGCIELVLTTTTAQNVDLTNLAVNTPAGTAGDLVFATVNVLIFNNTGATDLTVSPGGSNPSNAPKFTGTSPTIQVPAGSVVVWHSAAGVTIDSSHKVVTVTPATGGSMCISVGGA